MVPAHRMWPLRVPPLIPDPDEIHVWRAGLDLNAGDRERVLQTLSADERARREKYRSKRDGDRFVAARWILRELLGGYLGVEPADLRFRYGPFGKPFLITTPEKADLLFNLAHAEGVAICAVSRARNVGVDLERIRPALEWQEIAEGFFTPREVNFLESLPAGDGSRAFFKYWTRKEACLKARGEGLSISLDSFDVSASPGETAVVFTLPEGPGKPLRWSLQDIPIDEGFAAALAVEGSGFMVQYWQWPRVVED
jgi:4'-phosphopantetheinyl transferase